VPLRCPDCNKFRGMEELEVESVDLENVEADDGNIVAELTATINVNCPECGTTIGTLEVSKDVTLGAKSDVEQV